MSSAHRFYCSCGQDGIGKTWLQACGSGQVVSMATRLRCGVGHGLFLHSLDKNMRARIRVEVKGQLLKVTGSLECCLWGHAPLRGLGHAPQEMFEI